MNGAFTESEYERLLLLARDHWRFIPFTEALDASENVMLWRHDIDFSPQRALRLAQIEAHLGLRATYFVLLTSDFYNALERSVTDIIGNLVVLGHSLGLHFDARARIGSVSGAGDLVTAVAFQKRILEDCYGVPVKVLSFHNPDTIEGGPPSDDALGGMINASSHSLRRRFTYVSDSNGYWRYRALPEVLRERSDSRLQVLTHPEWWTPEPLSPRERVTRCIDGRARRQHADYDDLLATYGRTNVR
jgi:hypothetical protein